MHNAGLSREAMDATMQIENAKFKQEVRAINLFSSSNHANKLMDATLEIHKAVSIVLTNPTVTQF